MGQGFSSGRRSASGPMLGSAIAAIALTALFIVSSQQLIPGLSAGAVT